MDDEPPLMRRAWSALAQRRVPRLACCRPEALGVSGRHVYGAEGAGRCDCQRSQLLLAISNCRSQSVIAAPAAAVIL